MVNKDYQYLAVACLGHEVTNLKSICADKAVTIYDSHIEPRKLKQLLQ